MQCRWSDLGPIHGPGNYPVTTGTMDGFVVVADQHIAKAESMGGDPIITLEPYVTTIAPVDKDGRPFYKITGWSTD